MAEQTSPFGVPLARQKAQERHVLKTEMFRPTRKLDGDQYGRTLLLSLDQKYNNEWDKLSKDEQTAGRRRHFEIWRKYQCFDYATHDLPTNANAMDMTWVDKTEADPEKPGKKRGKSRCTPRGFRDDEKTLAWPCASAESTRGPVP